MTSFDLDLSKYSLGWSDEVEYAFKPVKGLNEGVVDQISQGRALVGALGAKGVDGR